MSELILPPHVKRQRDAERAQARLGPTPENFWSYVDKTGDCWLWTGGKTSAGYGELRDGTRKIYAHRFAYEVMVGPPGRELDHRPTCPKNCVRPDHLRRVTRKQNQENRAGAQANSGSGVRGVYDLDRVAVAV